MLSPRLSDVICKSRWKKLRVDMKSPLKKLQVDAKSPLKKLRFSAKSPLKKLRIGAKSPLKKLRVCTKKAPLLNFAVQTGSLKIHINSNTTLSLL